MVRAGTFFEQALQPHQEVVGQKRLRHVMMPADPRPGFVMIQAELAFGFFQRRFHRPAPTAHARQVTGRAGAGRVAQVLLHFWREVLRILIGDNCEPCISMPAGCLMEAGKALKSVGSTFMRLCELSFSFQPTALGSGYAPRNNSTIVHP